MATNNINLPKGWKLATIPDVVNDDGLFCDGDWIESKDQDPNGEVRLIQLADIGDGTFRNKSSRFLTKTRSRELNCTFLNSGDILLARMPDPLGRACIFPLKGEEKYVTAVDVAIIRPAPAKVETKFLLHLINNPQFRSSIERLQSGTTRKRISRKNLSTLQFPLPSLKEQSDIVAKIEELFSELDKGVESLKTAQQQLKVYRQAVLKWAFEGKLTNENVKDGELPEGWSETLLKNVCNKIQDGSHFSPQQQYDESGEDRYLYITAKNIRHNYMDLSNVKYVDKEFHESIFKRCNPELGDVLLTKDGVNTGEVTLNTLQEPFALLSSVCLFKTNSDFLLPSFLKYYIQSPIGRKNLIGEMTGTAIKRIVLKKIKDTKIMLPPLPEQSKAVLEIESRLSVCDKIEADIETALRLAEALRQSTLKKAFEGKLI